MKILITGASGYIGSCTYLYLKQKFDISGIDKIKNKLIPIKRYNLLNFNRLNNFLNKERPNLIIHLAAQSLVDETINKKKYYLNNVIATKNLIKAMKNNDLNNLIFSSTAALYKYKNKTIAEGDKVNPKSSYAKTKYECEKIIKKSKINSIILRFFNVCSSLTIKNRIIGEFHNPETHLIPTIVYKNLSNQKIYIYGNDYKTKDGSCVRDYVHIKDICNAIKQSIRYLRKNNNKFEIINIGSSTRKTNFEILNKIKKITNKDNKFQVVKRRKGDVDFLSCSIKKAKKKLNWKPLFSNIDRIINDEIKWVKYLLRTRKFRRFKNYL